MTIMRQEDYGRMDGQLTAIDRRTAVRKSVLEESIAVGSNRRRVRTRRDPTFTQGAESLSSSHGDVVMGWARHPPRGIDSTDSRERLASTGVKQSIIKRA